MTSTRAPLRTTVMGSGRPIASANMRPCSAWALVIGWPPAESRRSPSLIPAREAVANDVAAYALAVCCVGLGIVIAVMALIYQNWADANARPAENRWQPKVDVGGA